MAAQNFVGCWVYEIVDKATLLNATKCTPTNALEVISDFCIYFNYRHQSRLEKPTPLYISKFGFIVDSQTVFCYNL